MCRELFSEIFPFWSALTDAEQTRLCDSTTRASYPAGGVVHESGTCAGLTVVKTGSIRVSLISEEGREVTLYRLHAGDFCLLSASCVIEAITFDVHFTAEEDSECFVLSAAAFSEAGRAHPEVEIFALNKTVERFSDVMWVLQQILFLSLDARLAVFLTDERARLGTDTLHLTHEDIARNIGSAREAVSRLLKYFESEGIVALSRSQVRITDPAALKRLAYGA